jgi:hypothetical protein
MRIPLMVLALLLALLAELHADEAIKQALEAVRSVGPLGAQHAAATQAAKRLQHAPIDQLVPILAGLDGANPLATNWLRGIAEAVAAKHVAQGGELPVAELESFFADTAHAPRGRRLAYELIASIDPTAEKRLIPSLQTDPSLELRFDAIRLAIDEAAARETAGDREEAIKLSAQAFQNARELGQIKHLAGKLKELGQTVEMPTRLGFVVTWHVAGPFENAGDNGWDIAYPPEEKIDLQAEYVGKSGSVKWQEYATTDEYGVVDLNKAIGMHKGAAGYAATTFVAENDQAVEIRLGSPNATKVWVNGDLVTANRVYHTGVEIDQYAGEAQLKAGTNQILIKVCQNEQTEDWAKDWKFQLRVCDSLGGPVLSRDRIASSTVAP